MPEQVRLAIAARGPPTNPYARSTMVRREEQVQTINNKMNITSESTKVPDANMADDTNHIEAPDKNPEDGAQATKDDDESGTDFDEDNDDLQGKPSPAKGER
jgi:hypothetical protein